MVNHKESEPRKISNANPYPTMIKTKPSMAGIFLRFMLFSALFSNRTKSMSEVLKRKQAFDIAITHITREIKTIVSLTALKLKKGISSLFICKFKRIVVPYTIPLCIIAPNTRPTIREPLPIKIFSDISRESILDFL